VIRTGRGYYTIVAEMLFRHPNETPEGEITETFNKRLEKEILRDPTIWLWSHKRWKHKRRVPETQV
jgi:Kdo2-lipid IVA lauroyltransferase/acyltransferase